MNKIKCLALGCLLLSSGQLLANTISGNISTSLQEDQLSEGLLIFIDAQFTASDNSFIGDYLRISSNSTASNWTIDSIGNEIEQISYDPVTGSINFSGTHTATLTTIDEQSIKISFTENASADSINSIIQHIKLQNNSDITELQLGFSYIDLTGKVTRPDFGNYYPSLEFDESGGSAFDNINVGNSSKPAFVDIDNDGDKDMFIGEIEGFIHYFENTGTSSEAIFTQKTGLNNPFDRVDITSWAMPTFVDIDNDGDQDAFIGSYSTGIYYFENIGTSNTPDFKQTPEAESPMQPINDLNYLNGENPFFVDIDNDGDYDLFYGVTTGGSRFFQNIGTASSPSFIFSSAISFGLDFGTDTSPTFIDIDGDTDFDAYIGTGYGTVRFLENTGSVTSATFSLITGTYDLFGGVDVGESATPNFVDIDNDGDMDAVVGEANGSLNFFENTSAFIFEVIETNDAPVISQAIAPETISSTFIAAYNITDEEGDNFSLSLTGEDSQIFSVELTSGTAQIHTESTLTFDAAIDADSNNEYLLTLVAVDVNNAKTEYPIKLIVPKNEEPLPKETPSEETDTPEGNEEGPGGTIIYEPRSPTPGGYLPGPIPESSSEGTSSGRNNEPSSGGSFNWLLLVFLTSALVNTRIYQSK